MCLFLYLCVIILVLYFCYMNYDPMKSCLLLVLALIMLSPVLSFGESIICAYFICMLFLSGVFMILVYFTSLSKISFFRFFFFDLFFIFFFFIFLFFADVSFWGVVSMGEVFFFFFAYYVAALLFFLSFFFLFVSVFMNHSGSLRGF